MLRLILKLIMKSSLESQHEHKLRSKLSGLIQFHNKQCQTGNKPKNKTYWCLYLCLEQVFSSCLFSPIFFRSEYTSDCNTELNKCLATKFIKLPEHLDPSAYTLISSTNKPLQDTQNFDLHISMIAVPISPVQLGFQLLL